MSFCDDAKRVVAGPALARRHFGVRRAGTSKTSRQLELRHAEIVRESMTGLPRRSDAKRGERVAKAGVTQW